MAGLAGFLVHYGYWGACAWAFGFWGCRLGLAGLVGFGWVCWVSGVSGGFLGGGGGRCAVVRKVLAGYLLS